MQGPDVYEGRTRIWIEGREHEVPSSGRLLDAFQYLSIRDVMAAGFCWNSECCSCEVDIEVDGTVETVLACETQIRPGMRVVGLSPAVKYALRALRRTAESGVV
jgi:predicted molibdopterin-dependent oxidoreductase YjgC